MPTQLVVISGPDKGRSFALAPGLPLVIGRGAQTTTKLVDAHTSRAHCEVRWDGRKATVTDNKSLGGTFVNGKQITTSELRSGDVVRVGDTELRFDCDLAEETTLPPTNLPLPQKATAVPGAPPAPQRPATTAPPPPLRPSPPVPSLPVQQPGARTSSPPLALPVAQPVYPAGSRPVARPALLPQAPAVPRPAAAPAPAQKEVILANRGGPSLPPWVKQLHELAGKTVDRFHLTKVLGDGSSGVVFLARDTAINRPVALKVLRPEFGRDEKGRQRFVRGMKSAIHLNHPNLVTLYDAGLSKTYCWISMEHIAGESLAALIRKPEGERPGWQQSLAWAGHMAAALHFLHGHGILHRNVLPNNILIRASDQVAKLGDLMLAKAMDDDAQDVTSSGELVGNVYYLAPERTNNGAVPDGRSDLYSLGATMYTVVTGRRPFTGSSLVHVLTMIRDTPPEPPRTSNRAIPESFERVLLKLLAKRPDDRYQTAAELSRDLQKVR